MAPPTPPPPLPPPETMPTAISRLLAPEIHSSISRQVPTEIPDTLSQRTSDNLGATNLQLGIQEVHTAISHQPVVPEVHSVATSQNSEQPTLETPRSVISRPPMPMMVSSATWQTSTATPAAEPQTQSDTPSSTLWQNVPEMREGLASKLYEELRIVSNDRDSLREELTRVQVRNHSVTWPHEMSSCNTSYV